MSTISHAALLSIHVQPRMCPPGAALTDEVTFTDRYILICFPSQLKHRTQSSERGLSQQNEFFFGFLFDLSIADGSGETGLDHNTHHMSPENHQKQNKVINGLPAVSKPKSFTPK